VRRRVIPVICWNQFTITENKYMLHRRGLWLGSRCIWINKILLLFFTAIEFICKNPVHCHGKWDGFAIYNRNYKHRNRQSWFAVTTSMVNNKVSMFPTQPMFCCVCPSTDIPGFVSFLFLYQTKHGLLFLLWKMMLNSSTFAKNFSLINGRFYSLTYLFVKL